MRLRRIELEREREQAGATTLTDPPEPRPGSFKGDLLVQQRQALEARRKAEAEREERQRKHLAKAGPELASIEREIEAVGLRIEE